jgi:predicted ATPase
VKDYRESTVVAARFWATLLELAPASVAGSDLSFRHGLLLLFLLSERGVQNSDRIFSLFSLTGTEPSFTQPYTRDFERHAILSWLADATAEVYIDQIGRTYALAIKTMGFRMLDENIFVRQHDWLKKQFDWVSEWVNAHDTQLMLTTFDYGHAELTRVRRDVARESFAASLAVSCMLDEWTSMGDLFSPTARLVRTAGALRHGVSRCLISHDVTDHFTAMRLHIQDVQFDHLNREQLSDLNLPVGVDFLLLDPLQSADGQPADLLYEQSNLDDSLSSITFAQRLLKRSDNFGLALLIVPRSECTKKQWHKDIRRDLVEQQRIVAVIDFPAKAAGRSKLSAWLIAGYRNAAPRHSDQVLFINAEPLNRLTSTSDPNTTTDFIGALIAAVFENDRHQSRLLKRLEETNSLLANIFVREFGHGRYEASGLARSVHIDEVRERGFVLEAKAYLTFEAGDLWDKGTDRRQLDSLLQNRGDIGKRIYIIGNNGEGKSLLLRDIAIDTASRQRHTMVIAFGASDRFPKRAAAHAAPFYRYLGARTSKTGINVLQTAVDVGELMLRIHANHERLTVLDNALDLIGFTSHLFLIPKELKASDGQQTSLIRGIVNLASKDRGDRQLTDELRNSPALARKYKLGLQRANSRDTILPFEELSSGEQQIIALAAKMISEAKQQTLFLVDEPEVSLHVGWQRAVPKLFARIAHAFQADILVATHSPILIASAEEKGDYCFTIRDRALTEVALEDRNSVETALFEGFRTYTDNTREIHERCASLVAGFIESANSHEDPRQSVAPVLEKLDDMKTIIQLQHRFARNEGVAFDVNLIDRAKAAVKEMADLAASDSTREET